MTEKETINFWATVARVQTLADGGLRVTLDLPEDAIMQVAQLMACKRVGAILRIVASPEKQVETSDGQTRNLEKGTKRQSTWETAKESSPD